MGASTSGRTGEGEEGKEAAGTTVAEGEGGEEGLEDVTEEIVDTEQNLGEGKYVITLHCQEKEVRLDKGAKVEWKLSGKSKRHLQVTVGNKLYYSGKLPGGVADCHLDKKSTRQEDLIILTLDKSEPKLWKQG